MYHSNAAHWSDVIESTKDIGGISEECVEKKITSIQYQRNEKQTTKLLEEMHTDLLDQLAPGMNGERHMPFLGMITRVRH